MSTSTLVLEDYDVSPTNGFLPTQPPLQSLPSPHYDQWEHVVQNLQGLILSKRLRGLVNRLPVLSTSHLTTEPQWRRAHSILAFIAHAYIWGDNKPAERVPAPISIPFLTTCNHLELPTVATYAGVVLWNWKPLFGQEPTDTLANLDMIHTFTGSLDEKWFYLVSVAIEARGAALIPLMLKATEAARNGDSSTVISALQTFAERLDEIGITLTKMYDNCDPHVFYHRIRPFLAGSKNMADAGLPNGVIFDNGGPMNKQRYVQFSGGSNAQSSIIQFFDLILGVEHRPLRERRDGIEKTKKMSAPQPSFIHEMRKYMPGPHARFLEDVAKIAYIRDFVQENPWNKSLTLAYDAALAMISALRDKHIQIVSRYIIVQSSKKVNEPQSSPGNKGRKVNLAIRAPPKAGEKPDDSDKQKLRGTGGSSLIPFLRQARDETGEPAIQDWARRLLNKDKSLTGVKLGKVEEQAKNAPECKGLSGFWTTDEDGGGICNV